LFVRNGCGKIARILSREVNVTMLLDPDLVRPKEHPRMLPGGAGELEALTTLLPGDQPPTVGVVCHPHPLHGGTLQNKVVSTLIRVFWQSGLPTVRFNFRGVGKSTGTFDHGQGELDDLLSVLAWVQANAGAPAIWLAGFSFGANIAARGALAAPVSRLITVAPPVYADYDWRSCENITCPWIVVQGGEDEIVPAPQVREWATSLSNKPYVIDMPTAGHFFHGQLTELRDHILSALSTFS